MLHAQIDITGMLWIAKGLDFVQCVKVHKKKGMKKILLICAILALIVGCASPRKYKENRFTKQFQEADSMFNQKYLLKWKH